MLRDAGVAVVGVDFSQEVINANRLRHPDIQWECWDALQLADKFDAGHFDAIVGKTLIDCFLTRTDAAGSIRRMLQQCHTVLKDTGCMMLLDKASSDTIIGRGRTRQLTVDSHKMLTFRILHPQPRQTYSASMPTEDSASNLQRQWELEIEPTLHKHFVVRPAAAGCGSLVVWSTDHVATGAGIETGDLILGYRRSGSKNMTVGNATETAKAIRTSLRNIFLLMERPASGAARRKTASLKTRLMSRQSTSQWRPSAGIGTSLSFTVLGCQPPSFALGSLFFVSACKQEQEQNTHPRNASSVIQLFANREPSAISRSVHISRVRRDALSPYPHVIPMTRLHGSAWGLLPWPSCL
ncbi:unnamed protein product [Symbiodinium pilosum]|uniref:Methyltransferase type 11 domain-containing protein n=1 Tax=Symbiodinium pilosum TaxID=2952 RepID=A0A812TP55_SYMPI|nr:unnamed protein product [Symbiodinium pilosum]